MKNILLAGLFLMLSAVSVETMLKNQT